MDSATPYMSERSEDLTTNAFRNAIGSCILAPIFASARKRNFMNPAFLFLSALLIFTPAAEAASWHTLQTSAQMTLQANEPQLEAVAKNPTEEEKKKDKKLKVWDKITYFRPQQADPGDFYYTATLSFAEINCTKRTLRPLQRIYYDGDSNEIKSIRYDENEKVSVVVPDTPEESVFNFACTFKAEKALTKAVPRPKTKQPATQPTAATDKKKEPPKAPAAASAKPPSKPSPTAPTVKPAETKK